MKYVVDTSWKIQTFKKVKEIVEDSEKTFQIMELIEEEYANLYGDTIIGFNNNRTLFDSFLNQLKLRLGDIDVKKYKIEGRQ